MAVCPALVSASSSLFWVMGLPATAGHANAGSCRSCAGMALNWLLAMRSSSSWVQSRKSGKAVSWLHESISFCRRGRWPKLAGRAVSWLLVRMSQRRRAGRLLSGTWAIWQALKPTISSCGHWPSTAGNVVKGLLEANSTRSCVKRAKSSGKVVSWLPDRSSSSSVSARSNRARGNSVRPRWVSRTWRAPARAPQCKSSRVCMQAPV